MWGQQSWKFRLTCFFLESECTGNDQTTSVLQASWKLNGDIYKEKLNLISVLEQNNWKALKNMQGEGAFKQAAQHSLMSICIQSFWLFHAFHLPLYCRGFSGFPSTSICLLLAGTSSSQVTCLMIACCCRTALPSRWSSHEMKLHLRRCPVSLYDLLRSGKGCQLRRCQATLLSEERGIPSLLAESHET